MKKYLLVIFILLPFQVNSEIIKLACTPDTKWENLNNKEKIWFTFLKPKIHIHLDKENLKVLKLGFSKDKNDLNDVDLIVEKINANNRTEFRFLKSGLVSNDGIFNQITIFDGAVIYGFFLEQYRFTEKQSTNIISQMNSDSYSGFENAIKKYGSDNNEYISPFGGMSGFCEQ